MAKKRKKYTVKTKGRMFVIFAFFGAIIGTLGFTFLHDLKRMGDMEQQKSDLIAEKEVLMDEEDAINADIKRLSDSTYIARYVREKYFYSKEGELILRMK